MLTGTPLDLTPFGGSLAALGWLYWLVALAIVGAALWWPKGWWKKLLAAGVVTGAVVYPIFVRPVASHVDAVRKQQNEFKARLAEAMAHFEMRCKTAGEKIMRTVDKVDGVVWMKWRPKETNYSDQFKLDDPYGRDCGGQDCIANLLRVTSGAELNREDAARHQVGYRFVETTDPTTGGRLRYSAVIKVIHVRTPDQIEQYKKNSRGVDPGPNVYGFGLEEQPIDAYTARYGIIWDDISTREDREHWIAGGSLKVIDLKTNEAIAERIGYIVDRGQGSQAGSRSPWPWARSYGPACPPIADHNSKFMFKILQPTTQAE